MSYTLLEFIYGWIMENRTWRQEALLSIDADFQARDPRWLWRKRQEGIHTQLIGQKVS
jgi:hypothetical protein